MPSLMTEETTTTPQSDEQDFDQTWKIGDETMRLVRSDVDKHPDDAQA